RASRGRADPARWGRGARLRRHHRSRRDPMMPATSAPSPAVRSTPRTMSEIPFSPGVRAVEAYPFEGLDRQVAAAIGAGPSPVDFGVGDPREEPPAFIREALKDAIGPVSSYPRAAGLPELRRAIAGWVERRYGAALDADTEIQPLLGSKELVFSLAQVVGDR